MRVPRPSALSARARLTLLYTALVGVSGSLLVTATYFLLSANLRASTNASATPTQQFMDKCLASTTPKTADESLKQRCAQIYTQVVYDTAVAQRNSTLRHLVLYSVAALFVVIVIAALASWILAGRILRPVRELTLAARNASEHNLSQRLALTGPRDELRELADTFDDMLARLDQAFSGQRRFIANASHELRTPLTVMRTTLDVVLAKPNATHTELITMGNDVRRSVESAERLIGSLLLLARNERGRLVDVPIDLAITAEDVLDSEGPRLRDGDLEMAVDLDPAPVTGDPVLLERLMVNLVDNAIRYNDTKGTVTVSTGTRGGQPFLRIANTGPVIAPESVDSLFQPFTRLDERTQQDGFGLGLALVASIAAIHTARIEAIADPGGGLDITIWFSHSP